MAAKGARNNAVVKAGAAVSATAATSRAAKDIAACLVLGAMAGVRQELAAVEGAVVSTAAAEVAEALEHERVWRRRWRRFFVY
jgi:hypothetical protein